MPDQATDAFLPTLQFIPADCFAANEMLEKLNNVALSNDDIDLEDRNSNIVTFFSDSMDLNTTDLTNTNLDEDYLILMKIILLMLFLIHLLLGEIHLNKVKHVKKIEV